MLPPSGYTHVYLAGNLDWIVFHTGDGALFSELRYALGSMSMQDQRDLYERLQYYDGASVGEPSERGDYLVEYLLTTQPRWACLPGVPCRLA